MNNKDSSLFVFLFGAVVGVAVALLYAPKTGRETRAHLKKLTEDFVEEAGEVGTDLKEKGKRLVEEGKTRASEIVERSRNKYSKIFRKQDEVPVKNEEDKKGTDIL